MKEIGIKYNELKERYAALNKEAKEVKEQLDIVEDAILDMVKSSPVDGLIIAGRKFKVVNKRVYGAADWTQVYANILLNKDFSILRATLSSTRMKELEAEGVDLSTIGIKATDLLELSVTKA